MADGSATASAFNFGKEGHLAEQAQESNGNAGIDGVAWQKHAPLIYDVYVGLGLDSCALSVAWLPDEQNEPVRLAMGTEHLTDPSANEIIVAELALYGEEANPDADPWHVWPQSPLAATGAIGFGGSADPEKGPLVPLVRIAHPTEVNRVVPCPSRPQLLASKTATGSVLLFDYKVERQAGVVSPDATLTPSSESGDGFALDWSAKGQSRQMVATGGSTGLLSVWAVDPAGNSAQARPLYEVNDAHTGPVGSLSFSRTGSASLATVGDDGLMRLWDLRTGLSCSSRAQVSLDEVLAVDWNPFKEQLIATTGKDKDVCVWDLRSLSQPLHRLKGHTEEGVVVKWAPFQAGLLASGSQDKQVMLWDLSSSSREVEPDEDDDGDTSPELLFTHASHTKGIYDFSWHDCDEYLMCSVAEDMGLCIWKPSATVVGDGDAEGEEEHPSKRARTEQSKD